MAEELPDEKGQGDFNLWNGNQKAVFWLCEEKNI